MVGPDGLSGLMGEVDALGVAWEAAGWRCCGRRWTVARPPAVRRRMTTTQWVRFHAPSTQAGGAAAIVNVAAAFGKAVNAPVKEAVQPGGWL